MAQLNKNCLNKVENKGEEKVDGCHCNLIKR